MPFYSARRLVAIAPAAGPKPIGARSGSPVCTTGSQRRGPIAGNSPGTAGVHPGAPPSVGTGAATARAGRRSDCETPQFPSWRCAAGRSKCCFYRYGRRWRWRRRRRGAGTIASGYCDQSRGSAVRSQHAPRVPAADRRGEKGSPHVEGTPRGFLDYGGGLSVPPHRDVCEHVRRPAAASGYGAEPFCGVCDGGVGSEWGENTAEKQGWQRGRIRAVGADGAGSDSGRQRCSVLARDGELVAWWMAGFLAGVGSCLRSTNVRWLHSVPVLC